MDHGCTYNSFNNGVHSKDYLTSAGIGMILNYRSNFFGKIVVGFPLNSSKERDTTRIHFFLKTNIK